MIQCLQDQMSIGTSLADQLQEQEYVLDLSGTSNMFQQLKFMFDFITTFCLNFFFWKDDLLYSKLYQFSYCIKKY